MSRCAIATLTAAIVGVTSTALAQEGSAESHMAAAKAAAGNEHVALFEATCVRTPGPPPVVTGPRQTPDRST